MSNNSITAKKKVLIVDDSSTIRSTVGIYLKPLKESIDIFFAVDGFEAIEIISKELPDLIIADVLMPRLSGYQLCSIAKLNPEVSHIPFYMLSSKDAEIDKAIGRQCGASGYLIKPFTKQVINQLVQDVLFGGSAKL